VAAFFMHRHSDLGCREVQKHQAQCLAGTDLMLRHDRLQQLMLSRAELRGRDVRAGATGRECGHCLPTWVY
jgi:hypothetical protein